MDDRPFLLAYSYFLLFNILAIYIATNVQRGKTLTCALRFKTFRHVSNCFRHLEIVSIDSNIRFMYVHVFLNT